MAFSYIKDGSAMFSPGSLTSQRSIEMTSGDFASHAEFEKECQYCHDPLRTSQADLCVRCHTNIMKQIAQQVGTHSKIKNLQECRACHPDHNGRDFDPIASAYDLFDHDQTKFKLSWHQVSYDMGLIICTDCHAREDRSNLKPNACQDCHAGKDPVFMQQHTEYFGVDCLACHDGSGDLACSGYRRQGKCTPRGGR